MELNRSNLSVCGWGHLFSLKMIILVNSYFRIFEKLCITQVYMFDEYDLIMKLPPFCLT